MKALIFFFSMGCTPMSVIRKTIIKPNQLIEYPKEQEKPSTDGIKDPFKY